MMKPIQLALIFVIAAAISGCFRFTNCTRGEGAVTERTIEVGAFTGVDNMVSADIDFTYDSVTKLVAVGQANILDLLEFQVNDDGILTIDTKHNACFRDVEGLKMNIHLPKLEYVGIQGSGNVYTTNLFPNQDEMEIEVNGSADVDMKLQAKLVDVTLDGSGTIRLEGSANELDYDCNGSGDLKTFGFLSHIVKVEINGSGNAEVNADSILETSVNGSGDIYYKGVAPSKTEINGSGTLHKSN